MVVVYQSNLHKVIYLFSNAKLSDKFDDNWSFLAWYMDKNRPLPIGVVEFDEYRHDDFDRRKAEGFLKNLEGLKN
ncbi:hypothetical protein ACSTS3_04615 [Aquimarina muelleri]|uniref:hypothetical protein n=1 Tax=Aquimarina muelleri TaxID=279356 RepID=UPI003F687A6E